MTTAEQMRRIISEHLNLQTEEAPLGKRLREDLGADSLDVVEITMASEEAFDVEISDDEVDDIRTVDDFIGLVERLVQAKAPAL